MPVVPGYSLHHIHKGYDDYGDYWRAGSRGKKYYYNPRNISSEREAHELAIRQAEAVYASGWRPY